MLNQSINYLKKEDFQPMNYNFKFCQDIPDNVALANLKVAEDAAAKTYRVNFQFIFTNF